MCRSMNRIVGLIVMYRLSLPCPGLCPSPCRKSHLGPNLGASRPSRLIAITHSNCVLGQLTRVEAQTWREGKKEG